MNKEFYDFMCETLNQLLDSEEQYDINQDLTTYNLNSILFIKLIVAIEDRYAFEFDDEYLLLEKMKTINAIYLITQKYVKEFK